MSEDAINRAYARFLAQGIDPDALEAPIERQVFRAVLRSELDAQSACLERAEDRFRELHGRGPIAELDQDMLELIAIANAMYAATSTFRKGLEPIVDAIVSDLTAAAVEAYRTELGLDDPDLAESLRPAVRARLAQWIADKMGSP